LNKIDSLLGQTTQPMKLSSTEITHQRTVWPLYQGCSWI